MNLYVILPAYNEAENLAPLLDDFLRLGQALKGEGHLKVVLVDDGSTDNTAQVAESYKNRIDLAVEKHPKNLGLGPALRTGLKKVLSLVKSDDDVVSTMDADRSHSPDLIPAMRQKIKEGYDVVIASRYAEGGKEIGLAGYRKFLSHSCSKLLKLFFPVENVRDYTCGYRAVRSSVLKELGEKTGNQFFKEDSFVCMSELLLNLHGMGAKIIEVPLTLRYDLKKGQSKMKIFRTIFRYFFLIFRLKFN